MSNTRTGNKENTERKYIYRLLPCSMYEVERVEAWLEDMALQGYLLEKEGIYLGVAKFQKTVPQKVRYRLEATQDYSVLRDVYKPDDMAEELNEAYGWEFVTQHKDFFIYRCFDGNAREMNTDSAVRELSLKPAWSRQINILETIIALLIICPLAYAIHNGLFLTMLKIHTWYFTFIYVVLILVVIALLWEISSLRKLKRRIRKGGAADEEIKRKKDWKKGANLYRGRRIGLVVLLVVWAVVSLANLKSITSDAGVVKQSEYEKTPPFATMKDFAKEENYTYSNVVWFGSWEGQVREYSDWLAPYNVEWSEFAKLTYEDGSWMNGMLWIDYHEAVSPVIAERICDCYYRMDKDERWGPFIEKLDNKMDQFKGLQDEFILLEIPEYDVDFAVAYCEAKSYDKVLLVREGNTVIRATFTGEYDTGENVELEVWAEAILEKVANQGFEE